MGKSGSCEGKCNCNLPLARRSFTVDCNRSAARTNNRGERGSPCLTPLLHLNCFLGTPLRRTEEDPEDRNLATQFLHLKLKPLYFRISKIASCSIESKAFSKSILRMSN